MLCITQPSGQLACLPLYLQGLLPFSPPETGALATGSPCSGLGEQSDREAKAAYGVPTD